MSNYHVEIRKLRVSEYQTLRKTTGWDSIKDDIVSKALARDLFSICVLNKNEVVGMGRIIGDGAIYFYVQDVIVVPKYKGKGIGKLIMDNIEFFLNKNANNNSFIGLMAAEGVKDFYHKFGYIERPENKPGMCKMIKKSSAVKKY